jgi:hypothetical protein
MNLVCKDLETAGCGLFQSTISELLGEIEENQDNITSYVKTEGKARLFAFLPARSP